jgi:arylsulfatase
MKPKILWICTDQQRFDTTVLLGNPHIRTPRIDGLVASGLAFTHAYCQSASFTPSRSSFLTDTYPSSVHGCSNGNDTWDDSAPLIKRLLADAGYDCELVGKLHLAGAHGRVETRGTDGYCLFKWSHDPRDKWHDEHAHKAWLAEKGYDLGEMRQGPASIPPDLH